MTILVDRGLLRSLAGLCVYMSAYVLLFWSTHSMKKLIQKNYWIALKPTRKDKHFIVVDVEYGEDDVVLECHI